MGFINPGANIGGMSGLSGLIGQGEHGGFPFFGGGFGGGFPSFGGGFPSFGGGGFGGFPGFGRFGGFGGFPGFGGSGSGGGGSGGGFPSFGLGGISNFGSPGGSGDPGGTAGGGVGGGVGAGGTFQQDGTPVQAGGSPSNFSPTTALQGLTGGRALGLFNNLPSRFSSPFSGVGAIQPPTGTAFPLAGGWL